MVAVTVGLQQGPPVGVPGIFDISDRFEKFYRGDVFLLLPIEGETAREIRGDEIGVGGGEMADAGWNGYRRKNEEASIRISRLCVPQVISAIHPQANPSVHI